MTALAGFGDTFELDLLQLILNATPIANIADNASSGPLTVLEVALHSADPTEAGDQTSSELSYSGYARVPVNRNNTTKKWTVANPATNVDAITFAENAGASQTAAYFTVGTAHTGAGKILGGGTVSLVIGTGVTPSFAVGALSVALN